MALSPPLRFVLGGACASVAGIVIAASGSGTLGGVIVVAGWLALVGGLHRFGRAGLNES